MLSYFKFKVISNLLDIIRKLGFSKIQLFRDLSTSFLDKRTFYLLAETFYGKKLFVNPLDPVGNSLIRTGLWERETTLFFMKFIKPGMCVVDIGAHIGYYTILFSSLVGKEGKVYAFEPEIKNYSILLYNLRINNAVNLIPENLAIYDRETYGFIYKNFLGSSHSILARYSKIRQYVKMISLDAYFKRKHGYIPKIDLIKIDIEGAEFFAIQGMLNIIKNNPSITLCIEFNTRLLINKLELINLLINNNLYPYIYDIHDGFIQINPEELFSKDFNMNPIFKKMDFYK